MKIIVGLGNPGRKYEHSRHNVGFRVIDEFAAQYRIKLTTKSFKAVLGEGILDNESVMLVKPMTYMNNSGVAVKNIVSYAQAAVQNLLVICDDFHLPLGKIRIRSKGSSGGHKGLASVAACLDTMLFSRLRIGLGQPAGLKESTVFVLGNFTPAEAGVIQPAIKRATEALAVWIKDGINQCMNQFN